MKLGVNGWELFSFFKKFKILSFADFAAFCFTVLVRPPSSPYLLFSIWSGCFLRVDEDFWERVLTCVRFC